MAEKVPFPEKRFLEAVYGDELSDECLAAPFVPDAKLILNQLRLRLIAALEMLSYRERAILEMRFGMGDGFAYTLAETGRVFRLTRERIRQLQNKAIKKLRRNAEDLRHFVYELDS